jgi:hypothetical protein
MKFDSEMQGKRYIYPLPTPLPLLQKPCQVFQNPQLIPTRPLLMLFSYLKLHSGFNSTVSTFFTYMLGHLSYRYVGTYMFVKSLQRITPFWHQKFTELNNITETCQDDMDAIELTSGYKIQLQASKSVNFWLQLSLFYVFNVSSGTSRGDSCLLSTSDVGLSWGRKAGECRYFAMSHTRSHTRILGEINMREQLRRYRNKVAGNGAIVY